MKRLLLALLASAFLFAVNAQTLLPVRDSIGKLTISVDPRMELLGAVQIMARYQMRYLCNTRGTPYSNRVQDYFSAFSGFDAVKWTWNLSDLGFAFDAPPGFMLYCSGLPELKLLQPYSEYLKGRAHGEKNLRRYRAALKSFAAKSHFADFWTENVDFYRQVLNWGKLEIGDVDIVHLLESYYNMDYGSYQLILCPLFGSCNYATSIPDSDGRQQTYALVCVPQNPDGTLPDERLDLMKLLLHEFSHSFVNPSVERYPNLVAQSSDCFEFIREKMEAQAYPYWNICVNEHIVRAVVIRILEAINGPEDTEERLQAEEQNSFLYIRPVVEKLRQYEMVRDSTGISFADYVPQLLKVFGEAKL